MSLTDLPEISVQHMDTSAALVEIEKYLNALRRELVSRSTIIPPETEYPSPGLSALGHLLFTGRELKFGFRDPWDPGRVRYVLLASEADKILPG